MKNKIVKIVGATIFMFVLVFLVFLIRQSEEDRVLPEGVIRQKSENTELPKGVTRRNDLESSRERFERTFGSLQVTID